MNYSINAMWHEDNQPVALLMCNEAQDTLIVAFRSSALLGSGVSHLPLDNSWGSGRASLLANQAQ